MNPQQSAPKKPTPNFAAADFTILFTAIVVGAVFYVAVIAVVAYVYPWHALTTQSFATAFAFRKAFGSDWIVQVILAAALLSLLKVFNGNFLAASRLLSRSAGAK